MKKGLSPLVATVLLIAFTLSIAGLIGGWLTSLTKSQTSTIEQGSTTLINCTSALIDITDVVCSNSSQQLRIAIANLGDVELYDFSAFASINNTLYTNNTGGPNSTNTLRPGQQIILIYGCDRTQFCTNGATLTKVRVSAGNCPQVSLEHTANAKCNN